MVKYFLDGFGGSIHHVGKLWLGQQENIAVMDYRNAIGGNDTPDTIYWFGFIHLYQRCFNLPPTNRTIVSIHDPFELPIVEKMKSMLRKVVLITASVEVETALKGMGFTKVTRIPTAGLIAPLDAEALKPDRPKVITVCSRHRRKNLETLRNTISVCGSWGFYGEWFLNHKLSQEAYHKRFLDFNVYLCMSSAEGGPIPAMEAMATGCAVLTTRVGQMTELVEDGVNGYFIENMEDVVRRLVFWRNNPDKFMAARKRSIEVIRQHRDVQAIRDLVREFLERFNGGFYDC